MYTAEESSKIRQRFWTAFGKYMQPIPSATGLPVHWLNYKTGKKNLYFKMDAQRQYAHIHIELHHTDVDIRQAYWDRLLAMKELLEEATGETWDWLPESVNEDGKSIACIGIRLENVSVFREQDWPEIISFLKQRIIALDTWWCDAQMAFSHLP
jgi:hypothetical protein